MSNTGCRCLTHSTTSADHPGSGMSWGSTARPPRRATVSAMRRPATAVMLATTIGIARPGAVLNRAVNVVTRRDRWVPRHHEDVVVGQLVQRMSIGGSARGGNSTGSRNRSVGERGATAANPGRRGHRWGRRPTCATGCISSRTDGASWGRVPQAPPAPIRCSPRDAKLAELPSAEHEIMWLSGRPEWLRPLTEAWLGRARPAGRAGVCCAATTTTARRPRSNSASCVPSPNTSRRRRGRRRRPPSSRR